MLEETIRVSQYPDSLFFYRRAELVSGFIKKKKGNKWHEKGAKVNTIQC